MFFPQIGNIGGLILSERRYYEGIKNKIEVRLFEKYDKYSHFLLHPGRKYRKKIQINLLTGMTSPFGTAIEAFQYALRKGLDLCMSLKEIEKKKDQDLQRQIYAEDIIASVLGLRS